MSDVIDFIKARLDEEEDEASDVIKLNGTDTWRFDDGVADSERESERRFGGFGGRIKVAVHERVRGCHTVIDWANGWRNSNGYGCKPAYSVHTDHIFTIGPIGDE